jgi:undecaprenyl-phosphate 4-deoxy-4-formamido-L-arabinose transferase
VTTDLSVVIATYRSPNTLPELVSRLVSLPCWGANSEILLIDDGNGDNTWEVIHRLSQSCNQVKGFRLHQNVGQHAAILCGIRHAANLVTVTLDDDLQNPPEEIPKLLASLTDDIDVVVGTPVSDSHSLYRRLTSRLSKALLARSLGYKDAALISPFRLFRTELRESFGMQLGRHVSIDALLSLSTKRYCSVDVEHHVRASGRSSYSFRKLLDFFLATSTSASVVPLQIASRLGFLTLFVSLALMVTTVVRRVLFGSVITGFPFLASLIAGTAGVQLLLLGLLGQYIGHMHYRIIGIPSYVVRDRTDE